HARRGALRRGRVLHGDAIWPLQAMNRIWEFILGLDKGFLSREGERALHFNPHWPGQDYVGAATWNIVLGIGALLLVWYVYRREARSTPVRIGLGILRRLLLAFV